MVTIAELRPELSWSKDWLRNAIFLTSPDGSIQSTWHGEPLTIYTENAMTQADVMGRWNILDADRAEQ